jgi:hypothetical protein
VEQAGDDALPRKDELAVLLPFVFHCQWRALREVGVAVAVHAIEGSEGKWVKRRWTRAGKFEQEKRTRKEKRMMKTKDESSRWVVEVMMTTLTR